MASTSKRRFFLFRVGVLVVILFGVVLYAVRDVQSRRARREWTATLDVAIVLVQAPGVVPVAPATTAALRERVPALEARLRDEMVRHRGRAASDPFHFRVFGPVLAEPAPPAPEGEGIVDLARYALDLRRWVAGVDERASVVADAFDTRVYVSVRQPASETRAVVEGRSERGGRIGVVEVELDDTMVDLTLFVVSHELLHTLGADDTYDAAGRARVPDGLVEPDRVPLFPQRYAEVMARNRPLSPVLEAPPETIDELGIGAETARAIGWLPPRLR